MAPRTYKSLSIFGEEGSTTEKTMAMIIHGIPGSGNTTPIELLCSMAGVKMDMQVLAVWEGKQMESAFLAINPVSPS
jgi:hypothetical protein